MKNTEDSLNSRLRLFSIFVFFILIAYTYKLFSMQIIHGDQFKQKSQNISKRTTVIPAQRGEIFDREANTPMVLNIDSFAVDIVPGEVPRQEFDTVINRLSSILKIPVSQIEKKLPVSVRRDFRSIQIKSNVDYSTVVQVAESIDSLPGVSWHSKPVRNYVDTRSFSHIIGYVGDITTDELTRFYNKGYTSNSIIGKAGIEKQYDEILRGTDGVEYRTVDAKGRYIENTTVVTPPKMGNNLVLTIDKRIQKLAEDALGPRIGAAVVLKPTTGEVLAMVSYPFFDQNIFGKEISSSLAKELFENPDKPLLNRAVDAAYPPASTFKVIMNTAILNEKAFPPETTVPCLGEIEYGNRVFRCHIRKPGHGKLALNEALAKSCDIYYWTVCRDYLGVEKIVDYAKRFGLGQSTEIDLPSQSDGFVPSPRWKERRFHEKWLNGDTMNMSIGQGFTLASPLQVANMACMVINNGVIYKPHLLKEIRDPSSGEVIKTVQPEILHKENIGKEVFEQVRQAMNLVTIQGEARYPMKNPMFRFAGKTGTAEVGLHDRWHSWMVAYGPYDAPPKDIIVVSVIVEAVNEWEWWAPYAANIILHGTLANQTYDETIDYLGFRHLPAVVRRSE
ncbi:penicillin-binding protein 2 [Treponema denticola]|uniref:Penicillin-binding protein n=3 Tax=Treponema denticola TaxID=158 RepID=Q73N04_TREDE|nr:MULTISPECIES: penicillin-binding protein 2 [Treponema]AAS11869.1 penicillin-binding protein [Treponema denticola ATCC 35405]EMB19733.1 penicillin-binding protein 2 [Treponema denticola OTK]EMB21358.1 penicillin-binding protein 2 [Treponema denticola SP37]EMB35953.1 penicillin-binding protein 2 [Treponema denticola H-22]EMB37119.1 penicillin-binding protein 2 [Treponema denticola ATCC 33521]